MVTRASSRRALVDAAVEEFAENGYEATTVSGIAERAGVTTGALYAHFESKLDLLLATLGMVSVAEFWQKVGSAARLPWQEARVALSSSLAKRPDQRALLLLDTIVLARRDDDIASTLRTNINAYVDAMKRAIDVGIDQGLVDPSLNTHDVAATYLAITLGLLVIECISGERPSATGLAQLTDLLLQAQTTETDDDEPGPLARIRARADASERARDRLHEAITQAAAEGYSLRRIGAAAGISHERVRQIVS